MIARKAEEGNLSVGESQIARQILEADFFNCDLDLNTVDSSLSNSYLASQDKLPLNNRADLEKMKELDNCTESGTLLYFEFDLSDSTENEIAKLRDFDTSFLDNCFTFRLNVVLFIIIGNTARRKAVQ